MTRYKREKDSMCRYRKTESGQRAHTKANKKYRKSNHGLSKRRMWSKGLPSSEYPKILKAFSEFNGICQCCKSKKHGGKGWHLDHKGKKFRGILCHLCNCAAAFLRDDIKICKEMIKYLKRMS